MEALTIRQIDPAIKSRLRVRAAHHGRSMEAEAREILRQALLVETLPETNMAEAIQRRFAPAGGLDLPTVRRGPMRPPPDFE